MIWAPINGSSLTPQGEQHLGVTMRMIGHQVLLNSGDSTSRVLPIVKEGSRYRIQFDTEFQFNPDDLVATVDRVIAQARISDGYIVEVEQCATGEIVYSYEKGDFENQDIVPCRARTQPNSCYSLLFTLLEDESAKAALSNDKRGLLHRLKTDASPATYLLLSTLLLLFAGAFFLFWKKRQSSTANKHLIPLGEYRFDKRNTELIIEDQRIILTRKEADLLLLLYDAVNTTVEREVILNMVWGDQGDYIGRTLDVFISKLRKKLDADSNVKIVNIRGVGYKLVMDV
jgi:DNA-binding winged helix-turn-helix (wHTH) protein